MKRISISVNQDELDVVRQKLSFKFNKELTSEEAIRFLIEKECFSFTKKPRHSAEKSDIKKSIINGLTSTEAMKELGISRATFFRHKAKEKERSI
jgi:hypothetical protein